MYQQQSYFRQLRRFIKTGIISSSSELIIVSRHLKYLRKVTIFIKLYVFTRTDY